MPRLAARPRVARTVFAGGALVLALGLAACGSQLDPDEVADANGGTGGTRPGRRGRARHGDRTAAPPPATPRGDTTVRRRYDDRWRTTTTGGGTTTTGSGAPAAAPAMAAATAAATTGGGDNAADGGDAAPAATASRTAPGITDSEITIGNASDISGPVPGLFESSQDAVKAYVAYFNSTSDICGRKLKLVTYDSRTDAGADQQNYAKGCDEVFAMVGSMSAFDSGGAAHRAVLRAARHPLGGGHQGPQRLLHLLPRPVGQHRRVGERARASSSRRTTRTPPRTPGCSTSTPAPRPRTAPSRSAP